jgi:hypothetical protein
MESARVFLVETYLSKLDTDGAVGIAERAVLATEELRGAGMIVRYVQSIFIPADETCFHIFEAQSEADARTAASRAGIHVQRVLETKTFDPEQPAGSSTSAQTRNPRGGFKHQIEGGARR